MNVATVPAIPVAAAMPCPSSGIVVERYSAERKPAWNRFVAEAKNATFLFDRDYMEYHGDRFVDHSLVLSRGDKVVALLPANLANDGTVVSHQGLTYGGMVVCQDVTLVDVLQSFHALLSYLERHDVGTLVYKRIPRFYSSRPDDEIDQALFLVDARLCRRDCAMVVNQNDRLPFRKGRKSEISKARRHGVQLVEESDFRPFWNEVLTLRLASRYGVKPVHSVDEITLLASRFPACIRQFSAYCDGRIVAGATVYETPTVAHVQYSGVNEEGQSVGALDLLYGWLITERYRDRRYFDFGICNENNGRTLNLGLADWKEAFGGRSCAHDFYEVQTSSHTKLEPVLSAAQPHTGVEPD